MRPQGSQQTYTQPQINGTLMKIQTQGLSVTNCQILSDLLAKIDMSYLHQFIEIGQNYYRNVLAFYHKYKYQYSQYLSEYINLLHSKAYHSKVENYMFSIQNFKKDYQRVTKNRVKLLPIEELTYHESDDKLKAYKRKLQTQSKKKEQQKNQNIFVENIGTIKQQKQQYCHYYLKAFGSNYKSIKANVMKQLYFKEQLKYKDKMNSALQNHLKINIDFKTDEKIKNHVEDLPVLHNDCYGNLSYVYEDQDLSHNTAKQHVSFMGSLSKIKECQNEVIKRIVGYLNGRGGVIILGTKLVNHKILPISEQIIAQYWKQQHINRIQQYISCLSHNVGFSKHIQISFIPIAKRISISSLQKIYTQKYKKSWIKGGFLMRLIVTPIQPHLTYYYEKIREQKVQTVIFSRQNENQLIDMKQEHIYEFLKERYKEYKPSNRSSYCPLKERGNYYPTTVFHYSASKNVQSGDIEHGQQIYRRKQESSSLVKTNPLLKNRQKYKKITLIVCLSTLIEKIIEILRTSEKIQIQVDRAFRQYDFRLTNNTFLLFHNCKFQKIKTALNKEKNTLKPLNEKKDVLLISTQPTLKTQSKYLKPQVELSIQTTLKSIMGPQAKVIYHRDIKEKDKENNTLYYTYIKFQSNIQAIFMYFYLNHHQVKSFFDRPPQGSEDNRNKPSNNTYSNLKGKGSHKQVSSDRNEYDSRNWDRNDQKRYHNNRYDDDYLSQQDEYETQYGNSDNYDSKHRGYQNNRQYTTKYSNKSDYKKSLYEESHSRSHKNYKSQNSTADESIKQKSQYYDFTKESDSLGSTQSSTLPSVKNKNIQYYQGQQSNQQLSVNSNAETSHGKQVTFIKEDGMNNQVKKSNKMSKHKNKNEKSQNYTQPGTQVNSAEQHNQQFNYNQQDQYNSQQHTYGQTYYNQPYNNMYGQYSPQQYNLGYQQNYYNQYSPQQYNSAYQQYGYNQTGLQYQPKFLRQQQDKDGNKHYYYDNGWACCYDIYGNRRDYQYDMKILEQSSN